MFLAQKFRFGKYDGLTLQEVYQGNINISSDLLISYIDYVLKNDDDILSKEVPLNKIISFQVSTDNIEIKDFKNNKVLKHNWADRIDKIFRQRNDHINRSFLDSLDEFNLKQYKNNIKPALVAGCNPEYIAWCIINIKNFSIDERTFKELTSLDIHRFTGFNITYKNVGNYEYGPRIETSKYEYTKKIVELNEEKNYLIGEQENQRDYDNQRHDYNRRENDRNNFDTMTDGQIGSYDDWNN